MARGGYAVSHWQQHLVNAETNVHRAQFEVQRPDVECLPASERGPIRFDYLQRCCDDAIANLQQVSQYCRAKARKKDGEN